MSEQPVRREGAREILADALFDYAVEGGYEQQRGNRRVVHCSITDVDQELVTYRSGIEFVEPSERVDTVIADFIDAIKSGRRAL